MGERRIGELSEIEWEGAKEVTLYSRKSRELCRDLSMEFDAAAEEFIGVLSKQAGHPLLFGMDVRMKARKCAKRLRRMAELQHGCAIEAVKFRSEFRFQFANVINPPKQPARNFDWDAD